MDEGPQSELISGLGANGWCELTVQIVNFVSLQAGREGSRSPAYTGDSPDSRMSQSPSQEGADRTHSPTSDWQSDSSLQEELRQALDRTSVAESKAAVLQTENDEKQALIMQLMDDVGTLQSQLDEMQSQRIRQVRNLKPQLGSYERLCSWRTDNQ